MPINWIIHTIEIIPAIIPKNKERQKYIGPFSFFLIFFSIYLSALAESLSLSLSLFLPFYFYCLVGLIPPICSSNASKVVSSLATSYL